MSKIIFICTSNSEKYPFFKEKIELVSQRISPDNIEVNPPKIVEDNGISIAIFNPIDSILIKNTSVCMGSFFGKDDSWWKPSAKIPDGTYALFRSNKDSVEVISDIVSSRTIWYFKNEDVFIASTSQRAIVCFLQNFKSNEYVFPWMLSSGTLGPGLSWDKRIKCLDPDTKLLIDRSSWEIVEKKRKIVFKKNKKSKKIFKKELEKRIKNTFKKINLDFSNWVLPLSGGYDSRAIFFFTKHIDNLTTITWGLKASIHQKRNDAYIAKKLANKYCVSHKYLETDISKEPLKILFTRYLLLSEGRIDHIAGYMDGFKIWKLLFEKNAHGILRGDEAFGWNSVKNQFDVRKSIGLILLSDFNNAKFLENGVLKEQIIPYNLQRKNETLESWRDRLYQEFRIPCILSALTEIKCNYVEVINPLLSKSIVEYVRTMPDNLRTEKKIFKEIVKSFCSEVEIAKYPAIANLKNILSNDDVKNYIINELHKDKHKGILSEELVDFIILNLKKNEYRKNNKIYRLKNSFIIQLIPSFIKNVVKGFSKFQKIDYITLAFRVYIILKMNEILEKDALVFQNKIEEKVC